MANIIIPVGAEGTVTDERGETTNVRAVTLTDAQAKLLREYKKQILIPLGLKEALFCESCGHGSLEDGCKSFVTNEQIGIICRCTMRVFKGQTF